MVTQSITSETPSRNILRIPDNLSELQQAYGASCTKYEPLADKAAKRANVLVVAGYGTTLAVRNDALVIVPGKTHAAQKSEPITLYRAVHGVNAIILLTEKKGSVTLDALSWCESQEIRLSILDYQGMCIHSFGTTRADAHLRRRQYAAFAEGKALFISVELIRRKLEGQRATLLAHPELPGQAQGIAALEEALQVIDRPLLPPQFTDIAYLRTFEGRAADAYFSAWKGLPIKWHKDAAKSIPPHWKSVAERGSPLSKNHGARHATNPAQAILNYAYALLESQVRQSLNALGFDLACGFLHSDVLDRDSLVYDAMELFRPAIDDRVLQMLKKTTFNKGDCMTTHDGTVAFNSELKRYIVASCRLPQKEIDTMLGWLKTSLV